MTTTKNRMQQITALINECSNEECRLVFAATKRRLSTLASAQVGEFYVGQRVSFKSRSGVIYGGVVEKINTKTATVAVPHKVGNFESKRLWRVAPSLLQVSP